MSPRRKVQPDDAPLFVGQAVAPARDWRLPARFTVAGLIIAEAIAACTLVLISHESQRRAAMKDVTVLSAVSSFVTVFTSPDPFNANDYVERVLSYATGEFAKQFGEKANLALLAVARGQPTTGTVLDAGVERWNDDGSANVLVVAEVTGKSPDGEQSFDTASRWLVTAQKEGDRWKISSLIQVV